MYLFSRRSSLQYQTGDVSDARFNFTSRQARVKRARKLYCARRAHSSIHAQRCRARIAFIISYQIAKETMTMQCRDQLSHEVTKTIKAAIKLCMHVICYILVTLRTCL